MLGMLGHDMRTPLQSILMTATYLGQLNAGEKVSRAATRLISSGARMKSLLDELVEFNRANLGLGVRVSRRAWTWPIFSRMNCRSCAPRIPAVSCCWR